jgi:hypothetical protein
MNTPGKEAAEAASRGAWLSSFRDKPEKASRSTA